MANNFLNYLIFFIGVLMVLLAFFVLRKHQSAFFSGEEPKGTLQEKKLLEYIEIAEDIISEMNTVSDQVIRNIDQRTMEMCHTLEKVDKVLKDYREFLHENPPVQHEAMPFVTVGVVEENKPSSQKGTAKITEDSIDEKKEHLNSHSEINEILRLYDEGNNASQIAKMLNKGIGEVQLILNLRKR